ncbi:MAG: hypothetical protein ABUK01_11670 [Leptospirales bacterium]
MTDDTTSEHEKQEDEDATVAFDEVNANSDDPVLERLVTERQALQHLDPLDQAYSPKQNLQGIQFVYQFLAKGTNTFLSSFRNNLPTRRELENELVRIKRKIDHLDDIFDYLSNAASAHLPLIKKYYAAVFEEGELALKPVYIAGDDDIEKVVKKSDEMSAIYIVDKAAISLPWSDKESYLEFLAKTIKEGIKADIYFQGFFKFDSQDENSESTRILQDRIYPYLKGRDDLLYLEIPRVLEEDEIQSEPIILLNDTKDILYRYEYMSKLVLHIAKKIYKTYEENGLKKNAVYALRTALKAFETNKSPEGYKTIAETVLNHYRQDDMYRQCALEVFLMKETAEQILRQKKETKEAEKKKKLALLLRRIKSRQWLMFIPSTFYSSEIFDTALDIDGILGIRKTGVSLGLEEDHYCIIELNSVKRVLETANFFELSILEEILNKSGLSAKSFYQQQLYKRKKEVVFLFINPLLYLLRSLFFRKKKFIEKTFTSEIKNLGFAYRKSKLESFIASGIKTETEGAKQGGAKESKEETEKQKLIKTVMEFVFPDASPSAKHINEIEYKSRMRTAARKIKNNPEFPQYSGKGEEAVMADLEPFMHASLIEDVYDGPLPTGTDSQGRKFTRKTYCPKDIKDYPIIYNSIREEMEQEGTLYGSKDMVEYCRAKSKTYSESNMDKVRYEDKMRDEAEKKRTASKADGKSGKEGAFKGKQEESAVFSKPSLESYSKDDKKPKRKLFSRKKKPVKEKKSKKGQKPKAAKAGSPEQRILQTAQTLTKDLTEKYLAKKKFSGSNLFPMTGADLEDYLKLEEGALAVFANQNAKEFSKNFTSIRVGNDNFYFPKRFLASSKFEVSKYYDELIKHEEGLALPNREIVNKAYAISNAIKLKKL